jgi:ABC-type bacteriocin/lantibiotic exporter with double-glycine peptidase domain
MYPAGVILLLDGFLKSLFPILVCPLLGGLASFATPAFSQTTVDQMVTRRSA